MQNKQIKTGGRQKGTPNKITTSHRELIQTILGKEIEAGKIEKELSKLEGKDYLDIVLKLAGFVVPKLNSVTFQDKAQNEPIIIDWSGN